MIHLDADTLIDLGAALDWRSKPLDHVAQCAECRERFRRLAAMHEGFEPAVEMRGGFVDAVTASLGPERVTRPRRTGLAWSTARTLLGAALGIVTLGLAAGQGAPLLIGPGIVGVAAAAGALAAWWAPAWLITE